MAGQTVSVVIPIFNEEKGLSELWRRLSSTLAALGLESEVVFVDDGSSDRSAEILADLCRENTKVKLIRLSRNFGHQPALTAGIDHASGDALILMDGDLQDRPEAIPQLVDEWKGGADVVYVVRRSRREGAVMRLLFRGFYWMIGKLSGVDQPPNSGIFSLVDRRVIDVLKSMPEHNRYFPGLRAYAGYSQKAVEVDRDERYAGSPRVGFVGLVKLAFDAVFAFSYVPLRLATFLGLIVASVSFLYLATVLYHKLFTDKAILGWASVLGAILFLGGLQLIMLGLLGEYVGRIYEETKRRPYYVVADKINLE